MDLDELIAGGIGLGLLVLSLMVALGILVFAVVVAWQITSKTGYPGILGLLLFLPLANVVFLLVLAFGEWPVLKELKALKADLEKRKETGTPPATAQPF